MKSLFGTAFDVFVRYPKWWFIEFVAKPIGRRQYQWEDDE